MANKTFFYIILFLLFSSLTFGNDKSDIQLSNVKQENLKSFIFDSFSLFKNGALLQFKSVENLYVLPIAVGSTYYTFEHDEEFSRSQRSKKLRKIYDITGDLGVLFNTPLVPMSFFYLGNNNSDSKMIQFSKEYMASLYLTLIETGLISYIPSHERPNKADQSFWETSFRGKNSFPSGHIVPYSVLFFKTLDYYGPGWAIVPGVLTYFSSLQRIREGRHYVSDIAGAFWLSYFASNGVKKAGIKKDSLQKSNISFLSNLSKTIDSYQISLLQYKKQIGPAIILNF